MECGKWPEGAEGGSGGGAAEGAGGGCQGGLAAGPGGGGSSSDRGIGTGLKFRVEGWGGGRRAAGWAGALRGMEAFLVAVVDGKRDAARSRGGVARWTRERHCLCQPSWCCGAGGGGSEFGLSVWCHIPDFMSVCESVVS